MKTINREYEEEKSMSQILLVEDNPNDQLLTQRAFKKSNLGN